MIIEAKSLTKKFRDVTAVDELSLKIDKKGIYGLVGQNGAGKTTTLAMICSLIRPTKGSIKVFGVDVRNFYKVKNKVGASLQDSSFYMDDKVIDNLIYYAKLSSVKEPIKEAERVLRQVGLSHLANSKVKTLSHGMVKLLAVAQALIGDPELLIFDEPTSGLDPKVIYDVRNLINSMKGKTVVLSSHDLDTVNKVCGHIFIMEKGKIVAEGNLKKLTRKKSLEKLFLESIK